MQRPCRIPRLLFKHQTHTLSTSGLLRMVEPICRSHLVVALRELSGNSCLLMGRWLRLSSTIPTIGGRMESIRRPKGASGVASHVEEEA